MCMSGVFEVHGGVFTFYTIVIFGSSLPVKPYLKVNRLINLYSEASVSNPLKLYVSLTVIVPPGQINECSLIAVIVSNC